MHGYGSDENDMIELAPSLPSTFVVAYGLRARVEAQFSRIKRCIGDTLLTRRIASQTQEGRAIANLINQWNAFGQARCVKKP